MSTSIVFKNTKLPLLASENPQKDALKHREGCEKGTIDANFCPAQSHSHSVPNKHTKTYIIYRLFGLLA